MATTGAESRRRGSRVAVVLALAVGIGALLVLVLLADGRELLAKAESVRPIDLALPLLLSVLSSAAMARSYQGIAAAAQAELSFRDWLRITFVSNTANNLVTSAGLSGFAVRMLLLAQQGVSSGRAVTISLVQTFLTNFTLLLFILGGFVSLVARQHLGGALLYVAAIAVVTFAAALIVAFVLAVRPDVRRRSLLWTTTTLHRVLHRVAPRWTPDQDRLARFQRNLNHGFDFLLERKERMVVPTFWILFDWVLTVGVLWAAFRAVNQPLPLSIVVMGFGVGLFFSLVSFVPGGLGIMEGSMTAVFVSLKVPYESAFLAVVIFRLAYQVVPLVVSLFFFHGLVRQALRQVASDSRG